MQPSAIPTESPGEPGVVVLDRETNPPEANPHSLDMPQCSRCKRQLHDTIPDAPRWFRRPALIHENPRPWPAHVSGGDGSEIKSDDSDQIIDRPVGFAAPCESRPR